MGHPSLDWTKSSINDQDAIVEGTLIVVGDVGQEENDKIMLSERISFQEDCNQLKTIIQN